MGKIILVAESGSDITPDLRDRYGIRIVPMHVIFGSDRLFPEDPQDPDNQRSHGL